MRRATVGLAVVLLGCASELVTPNPVVTFDAATAWSGNSITAHSADFVGLDSVPIFTVGMDTLTTRYAGPGAVDLILPDTGGSITIEVHLRDGRSGPAGDVHVYGFTGWISGPVMTGRPYAWPKDSASFLVFTDNAVSLLDGRSGMTQPLVPVDSDASYNCLGGPVPAVQPNLFVVTTRASGTCGPLIAAGLAMDTIVPDTGPPSNGWPAIQLGRGRWLKSNKAFFDLVVRQPGGSFATVASQITCLEPAGFAISPRGDRVIPASCVFVNGGIPVFDPSVPQLVYKLSAIASFNLATFSARGDTLFAAGNASGASGRWLFEVDAASGASLAQAEMTSPLPEVGGDMAADADAPWIFVVGAHNDSIQVRSEKPVVEVYDRRTLTHMASLRIPSGSAFSPKAYPEEFVLALNRPSRRLYVLASNYYGGDPSRVASYNLPP